MPTINDQTTQQLLQVSHSALLIIDSQMQVLFANQQVKKTFGWRNFDSSDPQKKPYYLFDPQRGELLRNNDSGQPFKKNPLLKVLKDKKTLTNKEVVWNKKSGLQIHLSINAVPIKNGAALSISNISPYKGEVRWRQHLMRVVGHELKNPLASILALTETITFLNEDNDEQRRSEYLEKIKSRVRSTTRLVNDFLDTTRLRSGALQFRDRPQLLEPFIRRVTEDFQLSNPTHWISVKGECPYEVNFDSIRLTQVMENLLSNAVKYSPVGSEILVSMHTKISKNDPQKDSSVIVKVCDQGEGIATHEQKKIFQIYYQVGSKDKSKQQKGLGLGLYLVKQILQHYGTRPTIKSKPKQGTCIAFTLPLNINK